MHAHTAVLVLLLAGQSLAAPVPEPAFWTDLVDAGKQLLNKVNPSEHVTGVAKLAQKGTTKIADDALEKTLQAAQNGDLTAQQALADLLKNGKTLSTKTDDEVGKGVKAFLETYGNKAGDGANEAFKATFEGTNNKIIKAFASGAKKWTELKTPYKVAIVVAAGVGTGYVASKVLMSALGLGQGQSLPPADNGGAFDAASEAAIIEFIQNPENEAQLPALFQDLAATPGITDEEMNKFIAAIPADELQRLQASAAQNQGATPSKRRLVDLD